MDNQQVTPENLAWLAGIWDGEGTFTITKQEQDGAKKHYSGQATLTNTSDSIIAEIVRLFDLMGINFHLFKEEMRKLKHKQAYHFTVRNPDSIILLIRSTERYLISKRPQAVILKRFIDLRKSVTRTSVNQDPKTGQFMGRKFYGFSEKELNCFEQIRELNAFGKDYGGTSETLRKELHNAIIE